MNPAFLNTLADETESLKPAGLFKAERVITTPQDAAISIQGDRKVINLCANNYLGLANHAELIKAAHEGLDRYGYGVASVHGGWRESGRWRHGQLLAPPLVWSSPLF